MATKGMSVFSHGGEDYTINDPNIADEFSASVNYNAGDFTYYQGTLYRFSSAHPAGSWDASDVYAVKVGSAIQAEKEYTDILVERIDGKAERLSDKLDNTAFTGGLNIWEQFTKQATDNGVTFTPIIKNGKQGYKLTGTASAGIVHNINGYEIGVTTGKTSIDKLDVNEEILITGGLSSSIRVALEAYDENGDSLGFVQDSGNGSIYKKTQDAKTVSMFIIVNSGTATGVDIFPSFVLKKSICDNLETEIYNTKTRTYDNICEITADTETVYGVTFTKTTINGNTAYVLSGTSTAPIFFYLADNYILNPFPVGEELVVSGSFNSAIRVAVEYKDSDMQNTVYKQDMGNTWLIYQIESGMDYYKPVIIINNNTKCDNVTIIPKIMLADSLQFVKRTSKLKIMTFGDSIIADDFAGIGTKIAEVGNMTLVKNWAHGGSTASDWKLNGEDISPIELDFTDMYTGAANVLANQVRAALQYTTKLNEQITWTHPIDGNFSIATTYGVGLGHEDEKPDIILISSCTNDGHSEQGGTKTTFVDDDVSEVIGQSYSQLTRMSIASGIRWAVETLQCAYPTAIIFVNSPFQAGNEGVTTDPVAFSYSAGDTKRQIVEKISRFCSTHYIDSFSESGYSFFVAQNGGGIHPNGINRYNIAKFLLNEINNRFTERKKWY